MKIHVEGNIFLCSDEYQFILREYMSSVDKRTGERKSKVIGYYTSINGVINKIIKLKLVETKIEELHELKGEITRIRVWAQDLFQDIKE